jgi:hypothetical protein
MWDGQRYTTIFNDSYDIILKKSMNRGVTFEHDRVDSINKGTGFVEHLRLAASGNNVYALWVNGTIVPGNHHDLTDLQKVLISEMDLIRSLT